MEQRSVSTDRGALVSLWGLLGLFLAKGTVGLLTGSKALLADACQSAADCVGAGTTYLGIRKARLDPNAKALSGQHSESTATIVLSVLLLVAGLEIGISSIRSMARGVEEAPGWGAVILIAASIGIREGLVRYKRSRNNLCGIRGDRYVDHRPDIFASLTALVGTSGALVGEIYGMPFLFVLDPAAGLVISVFVVRMGYRLTSGVIKAADRTTLDDADAQTLLEAVQRVEGVIAVGEVKAKEQGHYLILEVDIRVNPRISVIEGQDIALRVKRQLTKRFLHIMDANVRVQPYDPGFPYKSNHHEEELPSFLQ
ncbi:cation diffusion facilitator family transporter [Cohnella sp.]|uniref:cation diffusion facilitator family transporter n=1 Tax=Cohnella sp. TaxID=1883426 RepID=UPI00356899D7